MQLALMNTTIATTDGEFSVRTLSLDEARTLAGEASSFDSAVGHAPTAEIMSTLLGVSVETSRQQFEQQVGQKALALKLNGRPPEGQILSTEEIEQIGYQFKLMTRTR